MDQSESVGLNGPRLLPQLPHDNNVAPINTSEDSSSAECLLGEKEQQQWRGRCRISEGDSLAKDVAGEKGDGSDSGVEFGSSVGVHPKRLTGDPGTVTPSTIAATGTDLQAPVSSSSVAPLTHSHDDNEELLRPSLNHCRTTTTGTTMNGELQREAYAVTEGQYSCDSSMLSFCSDDNLLDGGGGCSGVDGKISHNGGSSVRDCASEGGGSESSSVYNQPVMTTSAKKRMVDDKALAKNMSVSTTQLAKPDTLGRAKFRASSVNRVGPPALLTRDRARSKERGQTTSSSPLVRANSLRRPPKPDSLPVMSPMAVSAKRLSTLSRTQSVRTPGTTPSDNGRWPYGPTVVGGGTFSTPRAAPRTGYNDSVVMVKTRLGQMSLDHGGAQSTFDKYATMPRRRRERSAEQKAAGQDSSTRSSSISRDRLTGTTKMSISSTSSQKSTPVTREPMTTPKIRSVVRRLTQKVSIFHEKSSQTALTKLDLENAFAGKAPMTVDVSQKDRRAVGTQSEIRDWEMDELRKRVKHLMEEGEQLRSALGGKTILLTSVEQQLNKEREAKVRLQKELQCNSERVVAILESHAGMKDGMMDSTDSLMILETKVTSDSQVVAKQKVELKKLRNVCTALRQKLDEALERERSLIAERESEEMQEFLQIERSVLTDAVKTEEKAKWQIVIEKKDQEIKWLLEECRHLVRFCEQRRQENMGMQAKYGALEMRSKDLLAQQGSAVSGASVALNSLGSRLEQLVEQLIASYNISEQELEDVVFHNEAYPESGSSNGNGSCMGSPDDADNDGSAARNMNGQDLSPQRSHSFINVVINAIRNATSLKKEQTAATEEQKKKRLPKQVERIQEEEVFGNKIEDSDGSTDMLDSETEPCLMMENVLGESQPQEASMAVVAANEQEGSVSEATDVLLDDDEDQSLNNLSQAISNRQQIELQTSQMLSFTHKKSLMLLKQQASVEDDASHASSLADEMPSLSCDNCTNTQEIIEQVISVDNLITKLLKVMRIVQQDNDNCIQHLIGEKNKLQQNRTETEDKMRDCEDVNENLKSQLTTMTQNLLDTEHELNLSKSELQNCRHEIDKLNHHICELSALCGNKENNNECLDNGQQTRSIEDVLKAVMRNIDNIGECRKDAVGDSAEGELYNHIMSLLKSNRELRAELTEQKRNPNMSWQLNAINDLKRLYEVIDRALEVLNSTPTVIEQYPALGQLQKDLEETNFTLATTLPSYMSIMVSLQRDQNANPTTVTLVAANEEKKTGGSPAIDSMA